MYEAQIGHHYGLDEDLAIASLTGVPAHGLGLDHRIGYIRVGYDADVVIWDLHPLALGAKPIQVFIDGVPIFDENTAAHKLRRQAENQQIPQKREFDEFEALSPGQKRKDLIKNDFVATGIKMAYIRGEHGLQSISASSEPLTLVVRGGKIVCISSSCSDEVDSAVSRGSQVRHLQNGYVLPGLTVFAPALGLSEIDAEKSTLDGHVDISKRSY